MMADKENIDREENKKRLKNNMVVNSDVRSGFSLFIERNKSLLRIIACAAAVLLLIIMLIAFVRARLWSYKTYDVVWSEELDNASMTGNELFGGCIAVADKDGISCYDSDGELIWAAAYDMSNPQTVSRGKYILVYDRGGKSFIIADTAGELGRSVTSLEISNADISESGVVMLQTEDTEASEIKYYKNDAKELQIYLRIPMITGGFPLDASISPDGQKLMISYYYISGGDGRCIVRFYDFEHGNEDQNMITAEFEYETAYVPEVKYLSGRYAFAASDEGLSFFDVSDYTDIKKTDINVEEKIYRLFFSDNYIGTAASSGDKYSIDIYNYQGQRKYSVTQDKLYSRYAFQDGNIVMYEKNSCRIIAFDGRVRFDKSFETPVYAMIPAEKFGNLYMFIMNKIQKIKLR